MVLLSYHISSGEDLLYHFLSHRLLQGEAREKQANTCEGYQANSNRLPLLVSFFFVVNEYHDVEGCRCQDPYDDE